MKQRTILPLLPILLAMFMLAGAQKAEAASVGFNVSVGDHHHHAFHNGGVNFYTGDTGYTTWYPNTYDSTSYYAPSSGTTYYSDPVYSYSYPYTYSVRGNDYNTWYDRRENRHFENHGNFRRR